MRHLVAETHAPDRRLRLLKRLRGYLDHGYRDPELLYLGARYAVSLGMARDARRFLDPLAASIAVDSANGDGDPPAWAAVGILYFQVLPDGEERVAVGERLARLGARWPEIGALLRNLPVGGERAPEPGSPHAVLSALAARPAAVVPSTAPVRGREGVAGLIGLAKRASEAYLRSDMDGARLALEEMLLLDGDQPAILRNLVTIASEQHDVEAYERYWRRFVTVLLWRLMRGEEAEAAWQDLTRFYVRVASVLDRECGKAQNELVSVLRRPGFLGRWLESHAGLVWLDAAARSHRQWQTDLDAEARMDGRAGRLSLLRHWCRVFYPEFGRFLELGSEDDGAEVPVYDVPQASFEEEAELAFDPAQRMFKRFLEWSTFSFGLRSSEGRHAETVRALAGFVARIPLERYAPALVADLDPEGLGQSNLRREMQQACSFPFRPRMVELLNEGDHDGVVAVCDDADLRAALDPQTRLLAALAMTQVDPPRPVEALELACRTVPEMDDDELAEEGGLRGLFGNVIHGGISSVMRRADDADDESLAEKRARVARVGELVAIVRRIPEVPRFIDFRRKQVDEAEEVERTIRIKVLVEAAVEESKELVGDGRFEEARARIRGLPDDDDSVRELKSNFLRQIDEVEESAQVQALIETAIEESRELAGRGDYRGARRVIERLPDEPGDLAEVKAQLLEQVAGAAEMEQLNAQVERALSKSKAYAESGNFAAAKREIQKLPDDREDLRELKQSFLGQIRDAERNKVKMDALNGIIESAIESAKSKLSRGDAAGAKSAIMMLPNTIEDYLDGTATANILGDLSSFGAGGGGVAGLRARRRAIVQRGESTDLIDLKINFLEQIEQVERQSGLRGY